MPAVPKPNTMPRREVTTMRAMATIPWARRTMARHWLQEIISAAPDLRSSLASEKLNADGALADLAMIIDRANAAYRLLSANGRTDAPNFRQEPV